MTLIRWIFLVVILALPAHAADVAYPPGSRIGLVPPPGMSESPNFAGFEDRENRVAMVLVALPADAYSEIERTTTSELLLKQGITLDTREDVSHPLGKGLLVIGRQQFENAEIHKWIFVVSTAELTALVTVQLPDDAKAIYPESVLRTALASIAVRNTIPPEEQLRMLPFHVGELAGFKIGGVVAGRAVMLTDGAIGEGASTADTHLLIAIAPGSPSQASERDRFARDVFATVPNVKDVRIESSEPLRIGGLQGHQIMARGHDGPSGADVTIVQWLRFGGSAYLHLLGVTRTEGWVQAYARFRQVRDGIELR